MAMQWLDDIVSYIRQMCSGGLNNFCLVKETLYEGFISDILDTKSLLVIFLDILDRFGKFSELPYWGAAILALTLFIAVSIYSILVLFSSSDNTINGIGNYEYISIPKPATNYFDLLYIKLGYQTCVNVLSPQTKNLYSTTWGWATLDLRERIRISVAGARAKANGELQAIGHDRVTGGGSTIVLLTTRQRAAARFDL